MKGFIEDELILNYLDKNYVILDNRFFTKYQNQHELGGEIIKNLCVIFDINQEVSHDHLMTWSMSNGFDLENFDDNWRLALNPEKLKVNWVPELAQDLTHHKAINAEAELISILSEEIAREIDAQILHDVRTKIKNSEDFLGVVKCLGYEPGPTMYNPHTFTPIKNFISANYSDVRKERNNNPIWQNWIRTRKQNQEA